MWFTKVFTVNGTMITTVEANSVEEAEDVLTTWLDDPKNREIFIEKEYKSRNDQEYWLSLSQSTPYDSADIKIEKPKSGRYTWQEPTKSRVDLSIYFTENSNNTLSISGRKYYSDIDAETFMQIIKRWSKNYILRLEGCNERIEHRPILRFIATQRPEAAKKTDVKYVEV